uniref:Uncharacterized protein n=1 Tax=Panagrolaimus sp. ES5 TaxID=591445 RepID=A0AC34FZU3_9BILA
MFQLVVFVFSLIFCWDFCEAEFYHQDGPMGHFMEYSVEMPSSSSSQTSEPPTMFMRYGNIDKSGRYLRDFEIERPNYHHHQLPYPPSSSDDEGYNSMPPFPFSLPYQYIGSKRYPPKPEQLYSNHPSWNNNEREYLPVENDNNNRNSWARVYPSRESNYHQSEHPTQQQYFEQPHYPQHRSGYVPPRYTSTVDEIQNRVFSMMHNIASFPQLQHQPLHRDGHHRTGFSRESQYGYQMFI